MSKDTFINIHIPGDTSYPVAEIVEREAEPARAGTANEKPTPLRSLAFSHHQRVRLVESGETGTVIGRADFVSAQNSYLIRYRAADGRQVEDWWGEDAIEAA